MIRDDEAPPAAGGGFPSEKAGSPPEKGGSPAEKGGSRPEKGDPPPEERGREGVDWFWVLTTPVTIHRDKMLVLELESQYEFVPVFRSKAEAAAVLSKMADKNYVIQAMHRGDLRDFAASGRLRVHTVNGEGRVVGVWDDDLPSREN
ncbi:MAG: hypothetical protein LBR53_03000 [Deltaproteobacteria bacterium]|jgi:hypothetical protein|nr:hypothetical protein [Deltaproteobacteria bacterium]